MRRDQTTTQVATANPFDERVLHNVARFLSGTVTWVVWPRAALSRAIEAAYHFAKHPAQREVERMIGSDAGQIDGSKLISSVTACAIEAAASDIHYSPTPFATLIYFRIDGVLQLRFVLPSAAHSRLVSALKVESGMDIAEARRPQDGSISFSFLNEEYDMRVSSMPTTQGENMVVRILGASGDALPLAQLGFDEAQQAKIRRLLASPHGIVLATGPTGSGKTTTLYAALRSVNVLENNVMTVEDPVEYNVPLIRQVAMNEKSGMTFAAAIRGFLRQDPDVVLVGEIRDAETAQIAVRASQTGHLVPATLHTNDAIGAVTRMRDLGVAPYLLSASLTGVIAQRLVRRLCLDCAVPQANGERIAAGCLRCSDTGYTGRRAIAEVLEVDDDFREAINLGASEPELRRLAASKGLVTLRQAGELLVAEGVTSRSELTRCLGSEAR
jgi:type IV pilus assembly protein PilB